jgi:membrane protein implicated in regulation of membrane protease activity
VDLRASHRKNGRLFSPKEAMRLQEQQSGIESELNNRALGWVIATIVACVAGLGLVAVALLAVVVINIVAGSEGREFELPDWAIQVGAVALVLATAAFAWLVATAVERSRNAQKESRPPPRLK